ncbi:MAG: tRNA (adenosine(37)-N6)-threonylcarbamoyltransferase complex ATPase subunit type 1 TsaE [Alphaproteobacteria bacterium]|jgi:tRNA threonylcarbamoyl adenosine modification protein YjeE|nr:tRNA (adenosine(37)-N6)-threonylcarbamoyltransferase complex ATPase subunit type 1 TsaE [Hyphomicrobiales bacterium]|tara:strand:- start:15000 stop:16469 length:1470 start_codon:yes stop_codon:yes gene_type:complete
MKNKFLINSLKDTEALAKEVSLILQKGDFISLIGELGSGKTTLTKYIVNSVCEHNQEVTSPTFNLSQTYPTQRCPITHYDLYRIEDYADLEEIGFNEALEEGVVIIEWAEKFSDELPKDRLQIKIEDNGRNKRIIHITGYGSWEKRLKRNIHLNSFIAQCNLEVVDRNWMKGDASERSYQRIITNNNSYVVMNHNQRKNKQNPTKLAEGLEAFILINYHLENLGVKVPKIIKIDRKNSFLLLEDLGNIQYSQIDLSGNDTFDYYLPAVESLVLIQNFYPKKSLEHDGMKHILNSYDNNIYLEEVKLLTNWYWPYKKSTLCKANAYNEYISIWLALISKISQSSSLTLRDFHSPNLLWVDNEKGLRRCGIIDFQDALIGHPLYDVISLTQDARIDINKELETQILNYYIELKYSESPKDLRADIMQDYYIIATQRCFKILGVFARLAMSNNSPEYLLHMPRIIGYIERNFENEILRDLKEWFERNFKEEK